MYRKSLFTALAAALATTALSVPEAHAQATTDLSVQDLSAPAAPVENFQFIPSMVYRSGPYAPNGIPFANGFADYLAMLNERDGGIGGVPLVVEECDTGYNTDRGVACYEQLKDRGPTGAAAFSPLSTGITYALIERATEDRIPIISMGYGRADASDGTIFPYVFTLPATYWAQADAMITYIAGEEGGYEELAGKTIALVYHDSAYGREPIETLRILAERYDFRFETFPVTHPGENQASTWSQIDALADPDWILMWGWGIMNSTAIREAANIGFPMDRFIGVWWSGAEQDVLPVGADAVGYKSGAFHAPGSHFPVFRDIFTNLYDRGLGAANREDVGQVLYNRGLINAVLVSEAIRTAQGRFGERPLTGEEVRWGIENIDLTPDSIRRLGLTGLLSPIGLTCADHEGGGRMRIQQWDGEVWSFVSDWIEPRREGFIRDLYEDSAAQYAAENGIVRRTC